MTHTSVGSGIYIYTNYLEINLEFRIPLKIRFLQRSNSSPLEKFLHICMKSQVQTHSLVCNGQERKNKTNKATTTKTPKEKNNSIDKRGG